MTAKIRIPTPLRSFAGGEAEISVGASTVGQALEELVARHPELRPHLYDGNGALRNFVSAYLNDDDVRHLQGLATPVRDGDTITLVPSIAGGGPHQEPAAGTVAPSAAVPMPSPLELIAERAGAVELTPQEIHRYARHLIMPEVGMDGQRRLKAARVLLVGAGGLGSPLALYLAAAGVGTLGLVDFDVVDETNLQRQVLHGTKDVGRPKLESARERIQDVNPHVEVILHGERLTSENALAVLEPYHIVVDGTDNFPTRYLVNDACVLLGKPNVYGSIFRFEGQVSVFYAKQGPCYRCLFREPPPPGLVPSCAEGGVLGVLPGIIGTLQALETVKLILGRGDPLIGRMLLFDGLALRWRELKIRRNLECPVCGEHPTIRGLIDYEEFCGLRREEEAAHDGLPEMTATELKERLDRGERITIIDVREPYEWQIANLGPYGAQLVPLRQLPEHLNRLDSAQEIVLHCRSGQRSAQAQRQLWDAGFRRVWNLKGGILAWREEVDPSLPRY